MIYHDSSFRYRQLFEARAEGFLATRGLREEDFLEKVAIDLFDSGRRGTGLYFVSFYVTKHSFNCENVFCFCFPRIAVASYPGKTNENNVFSSANIFFRVDARKKSEKGDIDV